jgi:NAD-dependent dihydropyrimidine dehydrogenase PreA subunit
MAINYFAPQYEVVRDEKRCIKCRVCERQCANEVHAYDEELDCMTADEQNCVNCHRCVTLCPTRALRIRKYPLEFRENANWTGQAITEIYKQAESGGVLLSSMGNPVGYPIYWDKLLINASQVTNPSIDPLREPMETRVYLGARPDRLEFESDGSLKTADRKRVL